MAFLVKNWFDVHGLFLYILKISIKKEGKTVQKEGKLFSNNSLSPGIRNIIY